MKTNTIAVLARTPSFADAIAAHMKARHPKMKFVKVTKISDVPAGAEIASRGLPQFVPGTEPVKVHNVGLRMLDRNATDAEKKAQWEKVQAKDATAEDILAELGYVEEMMVMPAKAYAEARRLVTEARLNISEAEGPEAVLAAYKDGFNTLKDIFLGTTPAPTPEAIADEAPLAEDEAPI